MNLVYPTLKRGFEVGDYDSTLWLGKLIQNIYQTKGLFEELGSLVEMDFYKRCHEIDPENNQGNGLLLGSLLNWFSYCEHEWPAGILYGNDGASIEQCEEIRNEVKFALSLVTEQADIDFIEQFLEKLVQYETRLSKALKSDS
ncbi:hypothetical protein [Pseudoalteromonas luteoviolacea]|uniref:hypothetical protein n=1 Tax=Pseudoalteromonas luteoviolacea TaxID=43657 RepID=UPI001B36DB62|nr:hypothetical protein [Pseudoalteromonas luteoviolacea]MBQ4837100.1 hypothetical protein [Pseudoalteromonas luteoviolacea]